RDSVTTCSGGTCTTSVDATKTSVVAVGTGTTSTSAQSTGSSVLPQSEFCRLNPNDKACTGTAVSKWGGSCNAGFTCEGDAVMCATARAVNDFNCAMSKESSESALYLSEQGKSGAQVPSSTVAISSASFDQSDALGGAACITDLEVSVMGHSIALPMSTLCPAFLYLGNLLVAISFLVAIRIVSKGV
ncbi:MAG: hypothetical protein Q7U84_01925, partial [Polynucleobacter sp.]|nr:hypothetical protein [Polynucleobacter sp.]